MDERRPPDPFWEDRGVVGRFAARETDLRLVELAHGVETPSDLPVLDLGCAAGRNTVFLAERGFQVHAVDSSRAMVDRTRRRLAKIVGEDEAERRVVCGAMDDLSHLDTGHFQLVVALGIYHNAASLDEWNRALAETARVLADGGSLLVAAFTPRTDLTGRGIRPVEGRPHLYDGFPSGRAVLFEAADLDRAMAGFQLRPIVPSRTVAVELEVGRRVTVNALYRKSG